MDREKLDKLIEIFSIERVTNTNHDYLFYTQNCPLMGKPIIELSDDFIMLPMQKQLIHAIYTHLFKVCMQLDHDGGRIHRKRDNTLEEKTKEIFSSFFDKNVQIFSNYYLGENEKDLLVLYKDSAFIIECKAHKYREPMMNVDKAFSRIKDDFKKNIQKGYDQAYEVKELFMGEEVFELANERKEVIFKIDPRKYKNIFPIIVTQERYGQIQVDLGLLLDIKDDYTYPWSCYIDDLETFLFTLMRKENHSYELINYLLNREKLHTRVLCADELELAALYITNKQLFIKICNQTDYFLSSPTANGFFDALYYIGFGFKDELNLNEKIERKGEKADQIKLLCKKLKLKTPFSIRIYKKDYKST